MRMLFSVVCVVAVLATANSAPVPPPDGREAAKLIPKLGSEDFAEREAASKRLDELGLLALAELRAACYSDNPEIADRAKDLVRKIERRAANERAITPTLVTVNAKETPLDALLADISKQADYEVVIRGDKAAQLAQKKVTLEIGKVPFWTAVIKICDANGLQIASVSGFYAPQATPYTAPAGKGTDGVAIRAVTRPAVAIILEAREGQPRPLSVHGAVLIEAFELPKANFSPLAAVAILQVWPEPKLAWQSFADIKVTKALDAKNVKVLPDLTPIRSLPGIQRLDSGAVVVRNPDGSITLINPGADNPVRVGPSFTPNTQQSLVKLKTNSAVATELTGSVYGLVRAAPEPLFTLSLDGKNAVSANGLGASEGLAAIRTAENGKQFVHVQLKYDAMKVNPVRTTDTLPGIESLPFGNHSVQGLRITDSDGAAFDLSLAKSSSDFDRTMPSRIVLNLELEVLIPKNAKRTPAKVAFWGTYAKSVEVPFAFKNVPLVGGKEPLPR